MQKGGGGGGAMVTVKLLYQSTIRFLYHLSNAEELPKVVRESQYCLYDSVHQPGHLWLFMAYSSHQRGQWSGLVRMRTEESPGIAGDPQVGHYCYMNSKSRGQS